MHLYYPPYKHSILTEPKDIIIEYERPEGKKGYFICLPDVQYVKGFAKKNDNVYTVGSDVPTSILEKFTQHQCNRYLIPAEEALSLEERLFEAVSKHDINAVEEYIKQGANVNYKTPKEDYLGRADYEFQPYTPLRLVVFRISDSMLSCSDLNEFCKIARLLCENGADAKLAMELAYERYGPDCAHPYDENDTLCVIAQYTK